VRIEILEEAERELDEAIAYYEQIEPGLGVRVKAEAREIIQWILLNPELPRLRSKGYRRVNLKAFPYYVAYFMWSESAAILIMDETGKPGEGTRPTRWRFCRGCRPGALTRRGVTGP